jgi:hypothetical protein
MAFFRTALRQSLGQKNQTGHLATLRHDITYDVTWRIFLLAGATWLSAHSSGASPLRSDFLL